MERLFSSPNIVDQEVQPWNFWVNPFKMLKAVEMTNNPRVTKSWKKRIFHWVGRPWQICKGFGLSSYLSKSFVFGKIVGFQHMGTFTYRQNRG
jgi:hypothetical protein